MPKTSITVLTHDTGADDTNDSHDTLRYTGTDAFSAKKVVFMILTVTYIA